MSPLWVRNLMSNNPELVSAAYKVIPKYLEDRTARLLQLDDARTDAGRPLEGEEEKQGYVMMGVIAAVAGLETRVEDTRDNSRAAVFKRAKEKQDLGEALRHLRNDIPQWLGQTFGISDAEGQAVLKDTFSRFKKLMAPQLGIDGGQGRQT